MRLPAFHRALLLTALSFLLGAAAPLQALCATVMTPAEALSCHEEAPAPDAELAACCDALVATPAVHVPTPSPDAVCTPAIGTDDARPVQDDAFRVPPATGPPGPTLTTRLALLEVFLI